MKGDWARKCASAERTERRREEEEEEETKKEKEEEGSNKGPSRPSIMEENHHRIWTGVVERRNDARC